MTCTQTIPIEKISKEMNPSFFEWYINKTQSNIEDLS
jgi:hypothetical protein